MIDVLHKMTASDSIEALWRHLTEAMSDIGFDRLLYGLTTNIDDPDFGDPEDLMVLSNHDPAFLDVYLKKAMYLRAPMVRWAGRNTGSCSWSWLRDNIGRMTPEELAVVDFNAEFGITAGYTISFPVAAAGKKGAIGLVAPSGVAQSQVDDLWRRRGTEIEVLSFVFHLKALTLPLNLRARHLTRRQREVLEWVGHGNTLQEIARGLGVTVATVEKHLRLARELLGVETTAQAVLKAAMQNQIYLVNR